MTGRLACWAGVLGAFLVAFPGVLVAGPVLAQGTDEQVTEGLINAPVAEVWRLFTATEGSGADDLKVGGSIRGHYDTGGSSEASSGTLVNEVLAFEPERMLALRLKEAPAGFPYRKAADGTWTVLYFTPAGADMTLVRIVGMGYRDDPESQALRRFFEQANRATLDTLVKRYRPKCKLCEKEGA